MKLHYRIATKSMWAQRGAHVGALIGGALSLLLGWVPAVLRFIKANWGAMIGCGVVLAFVGGFVFAGVMGILDSREATPEYIKAELASPERWCMRDYLPKVAADKKQPLERADVKRAISACERAFAENLAIQRQREALKAK